MIVRPASSVSGIVERTYDAARRLFPVIASTGERSGSAPLPTRVRLALAEEQRQGEWLIGWVQAAAVLSWALLYAISRKTFPAGAPFEPVPWTLGIYGLFIAGKLFLVYERRLKDWHVALSIVVDVSVLIILIWSFHIQYQQPPAFYLKAPTLLYVFIFISLRTLRFEPRWVVLAGAIGAFGWVVLLIYAVAANRGASVITHDYVAYMNSSLVLLGAEFDKIISILMVTAVLAIALHRARRLLAQCIADHMAASELSRFVDSGVARRIAGSDVSIVPGQAEMRSAAAVFVDLRGFTPLAHRLPPASVMALLAEYQGRVIPIVQRFNGSIDKFIGDGILASFGAVAPSSAYAADAFRAVEAIAAELRRWREERRKAGLAAPAGGIGVMCGEILFGAIGNESRLDYTVIGDAVNMAAKLEKHTKAEKVMALTDVRSFNLAKSQGYAPLGAPRMLNRRQIEGIDHRLDLVAVAI
jgi:adenylate cyclase